MTYFMKTCLTTTILTALPVLATAAQDGEGEMATLCNHGFIEGDKNGDAQMSAKEIEAQRATEFAQLDADNDGAIDREEYVACIGKAGQKAQNDARKMEEQSEDVASWDDVDTADDSLTAQDFMALAEKAWQDSPAEASKVFTYNEWLDSEERYARSAIQRFNMQDSDNDGVLTKEEYETRTRNRQWSGKAVNARFESLDANGSGTISPQEYAASGTRAAVPGLLQTGEDASDSAEADSAQAQGDARVVPVYVYYYVTM